MQDKSGEIFEFADLSVHDIKLYYNYSDEMLAYVP